tara:strand:+ start:265 stop:438 length:174 start_codon:yes stop_codon:yes gene_type:complete
MLDGNDPKKLKKRPTNRPFIKSVKWLAYFFGEKSKANELTQYRNPVGFGPSSKTWPK